MSSPAKHSSVEFMALVQRLQHRDGQTRWDAAVELGKTTRVEARQYLVPLLLDPYYVVRLGAAQSLEKLGWRPETPQEQSRFLVAKREWEELESMGAAAVSALIAVLGDEQWNVSANARRSLVRVGGPAVAGLGVALQQGGKEVRQQAAVALGEIGDSAALPTLLLALGDVRHLVRRSAAIALGQLGCEQALEPLLTALDDAFVAVRRGAAWAVARFGLDGAQALLDVLPEANRRAREAIAAALLSFGPEVLPLLRQNREHLTPALVTLLEEIQQQIEQRERMEDLLID